MTEPIWHNLSINKICEELKTSKNGLSFKDVNERIKKYGLNKLPEGKVKKK